MTEQGDDGGGFPPDGRGSHPELCGTFFQKRWALYGRFQIFVVSVPVIYGINIFFWVFRYSSNCFLQILDFRNQILKNRSKNTTQNQSVIFLLLFKFPPHTAETASHCDVPTPQGPMGASKKSHPPSLTSFLVNIALFEKAPQPSFLIGFVKKLKVFFWEKFNYDYECPPPVGPLSRGICGRSFVGWLWMEQVLAEV